MRWRKVMTADYSEFELILDDSQKNFDPKERVYNHKGELLFWFKHNNPDALPLNYPNKDLVDFIYEEFEEWKLAKMNEPIGIGFHYSVPGFDCDGVPAFSHYDQKRCVDYGDVTQFEILTVEMVLVWYGYTLYRLKNANLKSK